MNSQILEKSVSDFADSNDCVKFRRIAVQISQLAASVNIRVIPFRDERLEHFSKLDASTQKGVLNSLQVYLEVYQAVQAEGSSLLDSSRVVWSALAKLGFRPTSDLFSHIKSGNVIEIHDNRAVQIFRNLVFFNFCSYSLEELYCFQMTDLYSRETNLEQSILDTCARMFRGEIDSVVAFDIKPHVITEINSDERLQIRDHIHYLAPVFSTTDESVAVVTIESAEIYNKEYSAEAVTQTEIKSATPENVIDFKPRSSSESLL